MFVSVNLLKAGVFKDWKHFLKEVVKQTETRRLCLTAEAAHPNRREWLGILYGTDAHYYSSLVYSTDGGWDPFRIGFGILDVEPIKNALNKDSQTYTLAKNPGEAEIVKQRLLALSESPRR